MEEDRIMRAWKQSAVGLAGLMLAAFPLQAQAATPEFARSEDEWAKLADNRMEYEEIEDLIHEYNATVKKNQIDLNEFRKDYGESNDEWADRYRELADDLESSLDYPDTEDSGYAAAMTNIVTSEMQIDSWREKADDALDDYLVYYYDYCAAEKALASTAQTYMINYYLGQFQKQVDEASLELLEETYRNVVDRRTLGMSTDVEVLTARENLRTAENAVQDDEAAIDATRERLLVLLGWAHDAQPEIGEIPEVDMGRIDAMNPVEEKALAVENSYTMKSSKRKLENARSEDIKEELQETIKETEQSIGAALTAAYQDVISAQSAYVLSQAQAELAEKSFATAQRQYSLGMSSKLDYLTQKNQAETARLGVETARLKLFTAVQSYEWAVNGLAGTS